MKRNSFFFFVFFPGHANGERNKVCLVQSGELNDDKPPCPFSFSVSRINPSFGGRAARDGTGRDGTHS